MLNKLLCCVAFVVAMVLCEPVMAQSNWTFTAGGTIAANDRVVLSGTKTVIQAGINDQALGIAQSAAVSGGTLEVIFYAPNDIAIFKANGVIAVNAEVYSGATGYVSATSTGRRIGKALNATVNAGDLVSVVILPSLNDRLILTFPTAATSVAQHIFIADKAYQVVSIKEIHSVVGGGAAAVRARKITDTSAPGAVASGTVKEITTATFDLTATINTTLTGTLSATPADYTMAAGDKLALNFTGTLTGLVGVVVVELKAQ